MKGTACWITAALVALGVALGGCGGARLRAAAASPTVDRGRLRFNTLAARNDLPLYWAGDENGNRSPDPAEVRTLLLYPTSEAAWIADGEFTSEYEQALARIVADHHARIPPQRRALAEYFASHPPALIETDLSGASDEARGFVRGMLVVASWIDRLYARQRGMDAVAPPLHADDDWQASPLRSTWGQMGTRSPVVLDVYPSSVQAEANFCERLRALGGANTLLSPFTVVREADGGLVPVPYDAAYPDLLEPMASELARVAADLTGDLDEFALAASLESLATALGPRGRPLEEGDWGAISVDSRWYVSLGALETDWEPCHAKAAFGMTLGRLEHRFDADVGALWAQRQAMEDSLAEIGGDDYRADDVSGLRQPDIVSRVFEAGVDRALSRNGFTDGERTIVYDDARGGLDAEAFDEARRAAFFERSALVPVSRRAAVLGTALHETVHALLRHTRTRSGGRQGVVPRGLRARADELLADAGALHFADRLEPARTADEFVERAAQLSRVDHAVAGVCERDGRGVELALLMREGAVEWDPDVTSADGANRGAFVIHYDRIPTASRTLMQMALRALAGSDQGAFDAVVSRHREVPEVPWPSVAARCSAMARYYPVYAVRW